MMLKTMVLRYGAGAYQPTVTTFPTLTNLLLPEESCMTGPWRVPCDVSE